MPPRRRGPPKGRDGPKPTAALLRRAPKSEPTTAQAVEMAGRANTLKELRLIWRNAKDMGLLTPELKTVIQHRVEHLKQNGTTS